MPALFTNNPVRSAAIGIPLLPIEPCLNSKHTCGSRCSCFHCALWNAIRVLSSCFPVDTNVNCHLRHLGTFIRDHDAPQNGWPTNDPVAGGDGTDWNIRVVLDCVVCSMEILHEQAGRRVYRREGVYCIFEEYTWF